MNEANEIKNKEIKKTDIHTLLKKANIVSFDFFDADHIYSALETAKELDLEEELIGQLVKEYVTQLIEANITFKEELLTLKNSQENSAKLDFTAFHNLAHKNLGVARNLRIKDCEELLDGMMKEKNLDYLSILIEVLQSCAIKLEPTTAFNVLK